MNDMTEEELRRILDAGSAQDPDLVNLQAQLAEQSQNIPMGEDLPRGTKVNFMPEASTPPPSRVPMMPKVVDLSTQPKDDLEMAYAKAQDREARSREAFERGARELVAGLTRTQVAPAFKQPQDAVSSLLGNRKLRAEDAQRNEANRLAGAKFNYEQRDAARRAAEEKAKDERDFAYRQQHDAATLEQQKANAEATRALAGANLGLRKTEIERKDKEEADKLAAGEFPLFDGTLRVAPGLTDTERGQARTKASLWNAADTATAELEKALQAYVANPSAQTAGAVSSLLAGASTALNTAYGQGAMAEAEARRMQDTLGADLMSPSGIKALYDSLTGNPEAGKLLLSKLRTARAGNRAAAKAALKSYGTLSEGKEESAVLKTQAPKGPVKMRFPDGSVHEVAPEDFELAKRKGGVING